MRPSFVLDAWPSSFFLPPAPFLSDTGRLRSQNLWTTGLYFFPNELLARTRSYPQAFLSIPSPTTTFGIDNYLEWLYVVIPLLNSR